MKFYATARLSENICETPEGFLICYNVPIARTGEMEYGPGESPIQVGPDGRAIVVREAKEVFRPETIASFEGKPFTITHPEDFVNPSNWKTLAKGSIQNVRKGEGANENDLVADIIVTDAEAIQLVRGGIREVSCGYECEYIELGVGRGMQTNIVGNHLALVEKGRAGSAYAINDQYGGKMKKLGETIRGIFAKAGDEAAKVVDDAGTETKESKETPAEETPAWAKRLETALTKVADAMSQGSNSQPSVMDEEKEEKESKDDAPDDVKEEKEESKDEEAPKWAQDMAKCMNAIMKKLGAEDEESEEADDAYEGEEESEDDDFEESPANMSDARDEASRVEILAPGLKAKGKDARRQALETAYKAKDTKEIIVRLNGGKEIKDFKKVPAKTIDHLFVGASEVVSLYRTKSFANLRKVRDSQTETGIAPKTAEEINEINAKHYQGAH